MITVTETAKEHIIKTLTTIEKPYLFFGLKGGGCAGFEYFWKPADHETYEKTGTPEKDEFIDLNGEKKLIIDYASILYLFGSKIDYKNDFISSSLVVDNPNAKSSCGCGTSIAV